MAKKEQKRTYVKPQIQVVEWNFNEEVCQRVYESSPCVKVKLPDGQGRVDHTFHDKDYNIEWNRFPGTN